MAIKNIHPHVGIDYTAKKRIRSVATENNATTMFAPFTSNRGPENVAYKVYNNTEFISNFGQLDFAKQGQVVLNIGNWLNAGGAVLAYRMTKVPENYKDITSAIFKRDKNHHYFAVNGILTTTDANDETKEKIITTPRLINISYLFEEKTNQLHLLQSNGDIVDNPTTGENYKLGINDIQSEGTAKKYYITNDSLAENGSLKTSAELSEGADISIETYNDLSETFAIKFKSLNKYLVFTNKNTLELIESKGAEELASRGYVGWSFNKKYRTFVTKLASNEALFIGTAGKRSYIVNPISKKNINIASDKSITINGTNLSYGNGKLMVTDTKLIAAYGLEEIAPETSTTTVRMIVRAKYSGSYYNGYTVTVTQIAAKTFKIDVFNEKGDLVETISRRNRGNYKVAIKASDYIGDLDISELWFDEIETYNRDDYKSMTAKLHGGLDTEIVEDSKEAKTDNYYLLKDAIEDAIVNGLTDRLSVKCDYILDAGYPEDIKVMIAEKLASADETLRVRDDIIYLMDNLIIDYKNNLVPISTNVELDDKYETRCIANYGTQYLTTEDIYSKLSGREVYVTPTYFLAGLIPFNEATYGTYAATAGKRRGKIMDALSLSENPDPKAKDMLYEDRINYIERDSSSIQFMSQSTSQKENNALRFLNASRSLNKISRDVESIGRNYLHEMTTVTSLNNLHDAISNYLNAWVQNRSLKKCLVNVYADEFDDTLVHIILDIQFSGTIEIISVEINID